MEIIKKEELKILKNLFNFYEDKYFKYLKLQWNAKNKREDKKYTEITMRFYHLARKTHRLLRYEYSKLKEMKML